MGAAEKHARLGPSNHRWPHCPGSVREEEKYPDIPGEAAIDGTGSHLLLEMCLRNNVRAEAYEGQIIGENHDDKPNGWMIHQDRIERVQMCLDYISQRVKNLQQQYPGCRVVVEAESKADPGGAFHRGDWWGTCDVTITVTNSHARCVHMEVIDYKDGRGWVAADDNTQLISYLFGKLRPYLAHGPGGTWPWKPEMIGGPCKMTIVQPKTNPVVRSCEVEVTGLISKAEELRDAACRTDKPDAPLIPDDKGGKGYCRWCKHRDNCSAHGERDLQKVMTMGTDVQSAEGVSLFELANQALGDVTTMDDEKLAELADAKAGIMSIFDKAEAEIQRRIEAGQNVPGYTMAPGRGSRVWNDTEENIAKKLKSRRLKKEDIYPPKLISPAQVLKLPEEKLSKDQKERIKKELIAFKAGKPTLTRVERKQREAKDVKTMFSDVTGEKVSFIDASAAEPEPASEEPVSFF